MTLPEGGVPGLDRREYHRPRFFCEVEIEHGSSRLEARTTDISLGGMLVETETPLWLGAEFRARLPIPEGPPLEVTCVVKQVVPGVCMGVEFIDLKPADHARLRKLVEALPH